MRTSPRRHPGTSSSKAQQLQLSPRPTEHARSETQISAFKEAPLAQGRWMYNAAHTIGATLGSLQEITPQFAYLPHAAAGTPHGSCLIAWNRWPACSSLHFIVESRLVRGFAS